MSTTYVKQDKFVDYMKQQIELDKKQDEILKTRFEVTQGKLEIIINNQVSFTEQLKTYNQLLGGFQKQLDNIDSRVTYLERHPAAIPAN
jgi:type IV secretory pathway VirB4 component